MCGGASNDERSGERESQQWKKTNIIQFLPSKISVIGRYTLWPFVKLELLNFLVYFGPKNRQQFCFPSHRTNTTLHLNNETFFVQQAA